MAYDPGALEAALAAAVGDEPMLIADLRRAFFDSAAVHVQALRYAVTIDEWVGAAMRLHSLAASFGTRRLMDAATEAAQCVKTDPARLRKIERAIAALSL